MAIRCAGHWGDSNVVIQSLSHVWLFATPWTAAHQAPLSSTESQNLLKFISTESVMLSNHLILCHPLLLLLAIFPGVGPFPVSQFFASGGQSIGASASVLPMNIQGWFPLGWTGLISLHSKGLSRVFLSISSLKHINSVAFSLLYGLAITSLHPYWMTLMTCIYYNFPKEGYSTW